MTERRPATIDEALQMYAESEPEVHRAWQECVIAAVGLGAAFSRLDRAVTMYGRAKRGEQ